MSGVRRGRGWPTGLLALMVGGLATAWPVGPAGAQNVSDSGPAGRISGVILDASGGAPLVGATVTLEPLPQGIVTSPEGGGGGFLEAMRVTESDQQGRYAFDGLPEATYRLRVARLGYRSATMHVEYRGSRESRVSIGLEVEPIQLDPVEVVLDPIIPMTHTPTNETVLGAERIQVELARQAMFTQSDVRSLTRQDMVEAVTIGETDLFRALHRMPGVTAADDWSAELWTRGARWDETRVYYDGLPLYNPLHAGGVLTGVSPDAVGAVMFHPGVRPVGGGDGSAGVVDLVSRPAGGVIPVSAMAQVSMVSGRFTVQSPYARGSGITFAGRRTWLDLATESASQELGDRSVFYPYKFSDVAGRWDQRLTDHVAVEVSGMWSGDAIQGDLPDVLTGNAAEWGNSALRATVETRWSTVRARFTLGGSTYLANLTQSEPDSAVLFEFPGTPQAPPFANEIKSGHLGVTLDRYATDAARAAWRAGLRVSSTSLLYEGPAPVPFPAGADDGSFAHASEVGQTTAWYEHRLALVEGLDLRAAVQADLRGTGDDETAGWLSPRITAAYALGSDARITGGFGRHYQFQQALAGVGFDLGPRLVPSHVWVQAQGDIPPIRSDIGSLGGELWLGPGFLVSGTAYVRLSSGTLIPAPTPGYVQAVPLLDDQGLSESWVASSGLARGVDLSLRRVAGRVTGSLSYSLGLAELKGNGKTFPAPGDRRHALDATVFFRLANWVRLGAAFSGATGAPYTRFFAMSCPGDERCPSTEEGAVVPGVVGWAEGAQGERGGPYSSADLMLELEGSVLGLKIGGFLQVRNMGANANNLAYLGSDQSCAGALLDGSCTSGIRITDRFEVGMPVFPFIGFWARF